MYASRECVVSQLDPGVGKWAMAVLALLLSMSLAWAGWRWIGQDEPRAGLPEAGLVASYQQLLADPATRGGNWLRTLNHDMQDVQGDLLWNNRQQTGMMRIRNLPDPREGFRYHVWIHDSRRPAGAAVSAAMLDSGSGKQERFVPLTAAEPVGEPYKFVLTLEPVTGQSVDALVLLMVQP